MTKILGSVVPPLYRYIAPEHVDAFMQSGAILMRALSYYRDYEDDGVRADPFEGTLKHLPEDGLKVTMARTGEVRSTPYTFESTAREDDIFVYCLSTEFSDCLASRFRTNSCIEICDPVAFLSRLRIALSLRAGFRANRLVHGEVRYYEAHEPPIVDWALPERISMRKPSRFSWQNEYRFAVPRGEAFAVENVSVKLVPLGSERQPRTTDHPKLPLKLGRLSKICRLHRW